MPTPKKSTKPVTKKPVTPAPTPAPSPSPAVENPGAAALAKLAPKLAALPKEAVVQPRGDVRLGASFVLSVAVPRLSDPALTRRLLALPATELDAAKLLIDLPLCAQAVLHAQGLLASAEAQEPTSRLPATLIDEATTLREHLLHVTEYHFSADPKLGAELRDIRSGTGYQDLAQDLTRLAKVYTDQAATLKLDGRFYNPTDATTALKLAARITSELSPATTAAQARDQAWRTWSLLGHTYEELAAAARFLLRHDDGEESFPKLTSTSRRPARHPAPAPTPAIDPKAPTGK